MADTAALTGLALELEASGQIEDARILRDAVDEIDEIENPPGLFSRMTASVKDSAMRQWRNVVGELKESKEAWGLLHTRIKTGEPLTKEQHDAVKAQILDVMRVVPAGLVASANATLPVPATGLFTPWLLKKMGLLPSRWREAHAISTLTKEAEHLEEIGEVHKAECVRRVVGELEAEAAHREEVEQKCALLTSWDANDNGIWDADEVEAYRKCVDKTRTRLEKKGHTKHWYFQLHGHVFGPVRVSELGDLDPEGRLLVCYDAGGWVCWADLVRTDGKVGVSVGDRGA